MFPFGDDWQQAGTIAAAAMNPHVKRGRKVSDFIPAARPAARQTQQQIESGLRLWARLYNGN